MKGFPAAGALRNRSMTTYRASLAPASGALSKREPTRKYSGTTPDGTTAGKPQQHGVAAVVEWAAMDLAFPEYGSLTAIWSILLAALLGFLIGLERERKRETQGSIFAGIRTFPVIAVFGSIIGQLSLTQGPAVLVMGFVATTVMAGLAYWRESSGEKIGGTTGFTVLVTFGLGIFTSLSLVGAALAGAILVTGLLSMRKELRDLSNTVTQQDLFAVVQFAAVSLIVLPLVPDEPFGPWGVWNPRTIWLQVVLISGISFLGYLAMKLIGSRRGAALSGILGGFASSTAIMLTFSRRSRDNPRMSGTFVFGALAASVTSVIRIGIIIAVVEPALAVAAVLPMGAFLITGAAGALLNRVLHHDDDEEETRISNPFELKTALEFALLFAVILLVTRAASEFFGTGGVYVASILGGLIRPDAVALSLTGPAFETLDLTVAVRALTMAIAVNSLFKATVGAALGSPAFRRGVVFTMLVAAVLGVAVAWLAPPLQPDWLAAAPAAEN